MKLLAQLMLLGLCVIQTGCFFFTDDLEKCREVREYQSSSPSPRIIVPEGLEPLADERRVEIPYGESNKQPTPKENPCLIEPPDYFDQSPV